MASPCLAPASCLGIYSWSNAEQSRDGDIVIAQVDREWTMKFFRRRGRRVFLEAANQDFQPIFPTEELKVAAAVRVVIRKYA